MYVMKFTDAGFSVVERDPKTGADTLVGEYTTYASALQILSDCRRREDVESYARVRALRQAIRSEV